MCRPLRSTANDSALMLTKYMLERLFLYDVEGYCLTVEKEVGIVRLTSSYLMFHFPSIDKHPYVRSCDVITVVCRMEFTCADFETARLFVPNPTTSPALRG